MTTVLVGNTRKAMTIVLSFLLFPKPFSWLYVYGGILVFGSLVANEVSKERSKAEKRKQSLNHISDEEMESQAEILLSKPSVDFVKP